MSTLTIENSNDLQDFVSVTKTTTKSISLVRVIRDFFDGLTNVVVSTILFVLAIPLGIGLYLILAYQVRKLRRRALKGFTLNLSNYKAYRRQLGDLSELLETLRPLSNIHPEKSRWYIKPFAYLTIEAVQIVALQHNLIDQKMTDLDALPTSLPEGWQVLTGEELWQGRPSDYEYLI